MPHCSILFLLLLNNVTEAGISAARKGAKSWRSAGRWFAGSGTLVVGLLVLVKVAIELSPRQGRSFKVPLVEGAADGVGRMGTWIWHFPGWSVSVSLAICLWLYLRTLPARITPSPKAPDGASAS